MKVGFKVRFGYACFGALLGFSAAFSFAKVFGNLHSSLWAALSGCYASALAVEHWRRRRGTKDPDKPWWYAVLISAGTLGVVGGLGGFAIYIVIAAHKQELLNPQSHYLAAVWCFMTIKWAGSLVHHSTSHHVHQTFSSSLFWIKIAYATGGMLLSAALSAVLLVYLNQAACAWAVGSVCMCVSLLGLHARHKRCVEHATVAVFEDATDIQPPRSGTSSEWNALLVGTAVVGGLAMGGGTSASVFYIVHGVEHREVFSLQSSYMTAVCSLLFVKWGFSLAWNASFYATVQTHAYTLLNEI